METDDTDVTYLELAERQHGLVTTAQLRARLSRGRIAHLVRRGTLELLRPGVYAVRGAPETWARHVLAAVLAAGDGAVASHRTAAVLHDLPGGSRDLLELTVSPPRRVRLHGVRVHRSTSVPVEHRARMAGIPTTDVARTLCDLAAVLTPGALAAAVDNALRRRIVTLRRLVAAHEATHGRGRRRSRTMAAVLAERSDGIEPGDSIPEQRIVRWLVEAGLPRPRQQYRVRVASRTYRVDCGYPDLGIDIEYDGWDAHRTRSAFDRDRARANELEAMGRTVFRFTSRSRPDDVVRLVRAALAARTTDLPNSGRRVLP